MEKKLSDAWTGFTRFVLKERPQEGYTWSGREDSRGNKRLEDPTLCGQMCGNLFLMHQNANKMRKRAVEKPKSTAEQEDIDWVHSECVYEIVPMHVDWIYESYSDDLHRRLSEKGLWIQQARCLAQSWCRWACHLKWKTTTSAEHAFKKQWRNSFTSDQSVCWTQCRTSKDECGTV